MYRIARMLAWLAAAVPFSVAAQQAEPPAHLAAQPTTIVAPPAENDFTAASLRAYQQALLAPYDGRYYAYPLLEKAEHFEWLAFKYHSTEWDSLAHSCRLPDEVGQPIEPWATYDASTWNGSMLAAMSYKWAVTRDPQTLEHVKQLLRGLHFYQQVTEYPGLLARCVVKSDEPVLACKKRYVAPDGSVYHYHSSAAKGTYNQVACGYGAMMLYVHDDLPPEYQLLAREDLAALALHLIDHDYRVTEKDGTPTEYGNLTPRVGPQNMPFNAQVAYNIVATAAYFPPPDPEKRAKLLKALRWLRDKHHVYYADPRRYLVCPQRVGANPLVKGMNDRNHVTGAAFCGLAVEIHTAAKHGRPADGKFLYELGQTMHWSMWKLEDARNSLCNFMWVGLLSDPRVFAAIVPTGQERARRKMDTMVRDGVKQLRHFPLDRFGVPGTRVETGNRKWADDYRPDYYWKCSHEAIWKPSGKEGQGTVCPMDYLHAYWLMRLYQIDQHVQAQKSHPEVLRLPPGGRAN